MDGDFAQVKLLRDKIAAGELLGPRVKAAGPILGGPTDWDAVRARNQQGCRLLYRAGVKIMTGTDLGAAMVFPGWSVHEELALLVEQVGLTPMEALKSATDTPVEFFGMADSLGAVEKGKIADLALLDANPPDQIGNTKRIAGVIVAGKSFDKPALEKLFETAKQAAMKK